MDADPATNTDQRRRTAEAIRPRDHPTGHDLVAVDTWLPGAAPTDHDVELGTGDEYPSRQWRCRACGAERHRPDAFVTTCPGDPEPTVAIDGGYSIEEGRTQRALAAELSVQFLAFGPAYRVIDGDAATFVVDVERERCPCDDDVGPGNYCEHLRRADIAIRTGELPGPDGRYVR